MSGRVPGEVPAEIISAIRSSMGVPNEVIKAMGQSALASHALLRSALAADLARYDDVRRLLSVYWHGLQASMVIPAPASMEITAPPPIIRAAGSVEAPQPHSVSRVVTIPLAVGPPVRVVPAPTLRPVPVVPWLDRIAFFIPKSIREPFLGDLREDLTNKAAKGDSRASVWRAAISQVLVLALRWAWSSIVRR
jgi:hypothetical protein